MAAADAEVAVREQGPGPWTGGQVWPAARKLLDFLTTADGAGWAFLTHATPTGTAPPPASDSHADPTAAAAGSGAQPRLRALELGSGTGWLGLNLARHAQRHPRWPLCGAHVEMTEQAGEAMAWLCENVAQGEAQLQARVAAAPAPATKDAATGRSMSLGCAVLDWCDVAVYQRTAAAAPVDVVLGSDLLYLDEHIALLAGVFAAFLRPPNETQRPARFVLYCHTFHRYDHLDLRFFNHLVRDAGFLVDEVCYSPGDGTSFALRPWAAVLAAEAFLEELFPEKRPAVLLIRDAATVGDAGTDEAARIRALGRGF